MKPILAAALAVAMTSVACAHAGPVMTTAVIVEINVADLNLTHADAVPTLASRFLVRMHDICGRKGEALQSINLGQRILDYRACVAELALSGVQPPAVQDAFRRAVKLMDPG